MKIKGKVISIKHESYAESVWEVEIDKIKSILIFTDLADTPEDYDKYIGENILFSVCLQLADIKKTTEMNKFIKNKDVSFSAEVCGVVKKVIDGDEILVDSNIPIVISYDNELSPKLGDFVQGDGELRIEISSVEFSK